MLSVEWTSSSGHTVNSDSHPVVKKNTQENLSLSPAIVFRGNTFTAISQLASCFNLQFFSESVFNDAQKKVLVPCYSRGMGG